MVAISLNFLFKSYYGKKKKLSINILIEKNLNFLRFVFVTAVATLLKDDGPISRFRTSAQKSRIC